jgi:triphosphoribosyl-dephospho-CoA synthase
MQLSLGQCATLACVLEATAPKVGNVHRGADFDDLTFHDFAVSAVAIGPVFEAAAGNGIGCVVLEAIKATRRVVTTNTNLGIALLFAPLAVVPRGERLTTAKVGEVLKNLTAKDSRDVYEAIQLAKPGGMGQAEAMDVAGEAPADLLAAMRAAAGRDLVAQQYVDNFQLVLDKTLPEIVAGCGRGWSLTDSIVRTHVLLIAQHGDSLIQRKSGPEIAGRASTIAKQVLSAGQPGDEDYYAALSDFDFWLRSDGNRRNPGTTADLIAAALFAGLRDGVLTPPWR